MEQSVKIKSKNKQYKVQNIDRNKEQKKQQNKEQIKLQNEGGNKEQKKEKNKVET